MKLILTAVLAILMQLASARSETTDKFVEFWKLVWCDFGGLYGFRDFACPTSVPMKPMISAGQRTNNTAGYALDTKMWTGTTDDYTSECVFIQLTADIPKPTVGNIIEMSISVQSIPTTNSSSTAASTFDTGICATTYQSDASLSKMTWETQDLSSTFATKPYDLTGSYSSAYANVLDTKQGGTSSWRVKQSLSSNTCTTAYCTYTCVLYRPLVNYDNFDVQFTKGSTYQTQAGYKVYANAAATSPAARGTSLYPFVQFTL